MTVRDTVPEGLQYLRSEPPAIVEGNQLTWTLAPLPAGTVRTRSRSVFRLQRVGRVTNSAGGHDGEGLQAENCATTQITAPQLKVAKAGPATGVVGVPITYQITVTNPGTGPATNVHAQRRLRRRVWSTNPRPTRWSCRSARWRRGETKTVPLTLTPRGRAGWSTA